MCEKIRLIKKVSLADHKPDSIYYDGDGETGNHENSNQKGKGQRKTNTR